ncbi:MAG: putative rRNA maturation factor [Planctomycetota bacterium]|jgi:probable rRNA maturation factor
MSTVDVCFEQEAPGVSESDVEGAVLTTLQEEQANLDMSIVLMDDEAIHRLNREFLDHDYATDVITFDLRDDGPGPGADAEIVISVDTAKREADLRNVSFKSEVLLYCIHGTLHLLGYDDHDPEDRRRMHARQTEILAKIGYETTA